MIEKFDIKFLLTSVVITLGSFPCIAMEASDEKEKEHESLHQVSSEKFIDGEFDDSRHKVIQSILNNFYDKKDFESLVERINLLNALGDQVNQSGILINLFESMEQHYNGSILELYEQYEKAAKKIGNIPAAVKDWIRKDLDKYYRFILSNNIICLARILISAVQFYKVALAGDLISNDYYQMGVILSVYTESRRDGLEYLEKYLAQMQGVEANNEIITASCSLNCWQDQTSRIDYIANLQLSPETLIDWVRGNYNKIEPPNIIMACYAYNYIINNFRTFCSYEDYLRKDFWFCRVNSGQYDYLEFTSDTSRQSLLSTFKSFSFCELKKFYENFAKENIEQKETRNLAFFSLLCLRELLNHSKENDFDITLLILESHMKYFTSKNSHSSYVEKQRDNLFKNACQSYAQHRRSNTAIDSYRLGKIAYKISKRKKQWLEHKNKRTDELKKQDFVKSLELSKNFFVRVLEQCPLSSILSKSYYYLSIIKSIENDTREAKEYLDLANFWKDEKQSKKITDLRTQIARSAFAERNYSEALKQYNEIDNIQGQLDKESAVIKLLCLNKLGYKDAANQLFEELLQDKRGSGFLRELFDRAFNDQDNESICLLYKLMKSYGFSLEDIIGSYLSAQFNLHNLEEFCTEAETYLSGPIDDCAIICTLPHLIKAYSNLNEWEKFSEYLGQYIKVSKKYLQQISQEQNDKINKNAAECLEYKAIDLTTDRILQFIMRDNVQKKFVITLIEQFHSTSFPISCEKRIQMAQIFSDVNNHQAAYDSLVKAIRFRNGVKLDIKSESTMVPKVLKERSKNFEDAHKALKMASPQILTSLLELRKESDLNYFVKYLKEKHKIYMKVTKREQRGRGKAKQQDVSGIARQHIVTSFYEESAKKYEEAKHLVIALDEILQSEWQQLKVINSEILIANAKALLNICTENFIMLEKIAKGNESSPEVIKKARNAYDDFNKDVCQLNQMLSKSLIEISLTRKQEENRRFLENTYQISEDDFLGVNDVGSRENYRASKKLREIQDLQKQALIEVKQKLRKQNRALLEQEYQENLPKESVEEEVSPDVLLVKCNILPFESGDYSKEHSILLHQILSRKFSLNDKDQETLRIILTRGERAFQITLNDIIRLFSKFEGFTDDVHHGGSHRKISGMGLTLMPNTDGIKKGSYWGQIEEAKEKIIEIIAKTLMVKDLENMKYTPEEKM